MAAQKIQHSLSNTTLLEGLAPHLQPLAGDARQYDGLLPLRDDSAPRSLVTSQRLQRAIGVIYRPDTERQSHYFFTRLARQFDAAIHIDETNALEPLDVGQVWIDGEVPETFPSGLWPLRKYDENERY